MSSSNRATRTLTTAPSRTLLLALAVTLLAWHLYQARLLSALWDTLKRQIEDDDENDESWKRLEILRLSVGMGYFLQLTSALFAGVGIAGTVKSSPPMLRAFSVSGFLSLFGEMLLLALTSLLLFQSSSSASFSASLCEAVAHSDISSLEVLGWNLESCEERWKGLATGFTGLIAAIALIRAWAAYQALAYYTSLARQQRRKVPLSINTHLPSSSSPPHYSDSPMRSPSSGKRSATHGQRIFLLPGPVEAGAQDQGIPMIGVTPSSPVGPYPPGPTEGPTFPPPPVGAAMQLGSSSGDDQKFLVYAPVMMTADQARRLNAKEISYSSRNRPRTHSHSLTPHSATSTSVEEALLSPEEEDLSGVKGKLA